MGRVYQAGRLIPWSPFMLQDAREAAESLGKINNSITGGGGNLAGYLAEYAVADWIGAKVVSSLPGVEKYGHDLMLDGMRIEVKTKRRTVAPKPDYEVSVAETSYHQRPDLYCFVSMHFGHKKGDSYYELRGIFINGFISCERFFREGRSLKKGQVDGTNNYTVRANCTNMMVRDLFDFEEIWDFTNKTFRRSN